MPAERYKTKMTLREMELQELNENLRARFPQQRVSESKRPAGSGNGLTAESLRPGATFGIDAEGNLRPLKLTESAAGGEAEKAAEEGDIQIFESLGMSRQAAEHAARGREERY